MPGLVDDSFIVLACLYSGAVFILQLLGHVLWARLLFSHVVVCTNSTSRSPY